MKLEPPGRIPSPAADGVYDFQARISEILAGVDDPFVERSLSGMPLVALEPHPDDLVLSAGGWLAGSRRPLLVISVCSESAAVHPESDLHKRDRDEIVGIRHAENLAAVQALRGELVELGMRDAEPPYRSHPASAGQELAEQIRPHLPGVPGKDFELIAPASVTRHPDHIWVHQAARALGCSRFWEDVAFFPTYARNVEDRRWFAGSHGVDLEPQEIEIEATLVAKARLLGCYPSQAPSLREICGVLRYAWAVADESGLPDSFMEREYRLR